MDEEDLSWTPVAELSVGRRAVLDQRLAQARGIGCDLLVAARALRESGASELDAWGQAGVLVADPLAATLAYGRDPLGLAMGIIAYLAVHGEYRPAP